MSDTIDVGAVKASEGFFLLREHEHSPWQTRPDSADGWRFCSTFRESAPDLRNAVFDLIRKAKRKVFITSFILGDDELIDLLAATARRLTGGVYVISGLNERSLRAGLEELADRDERNEEITRKVEAEKKRFVSLTNNGVAVRGHDNCHAKFVVVDDEVAWVGSANLETRAFTRVGEVGVVLDDPQSVVRLARFFARMWLADCKYELPAFIDGYQIVERPDAPPVDFSVPNSVGDGRAEVVWTDSASGSADEANLYLSLRDVIRRARRHLLLSSFNLNQMQERPDLVLKPVAEAIERGVRVRLLVRALNDRDRHRRDAGLFHALGVEVLADDANHAKAAIADDTYGLLFSANFDAVHGLLAGSGVEVGARLDGTPALAQLADYSRHALACATRSYVPEPTGRQLSVGLSETMPRWQMGQEMAVACSAELWRDFCQEARRFPVLWSQRKTQPVELLAGRLRLSLRNSGGTCLMTLDSAEGQPAWGQAMRQVIRSAQWRQTKEDPTRGVCAGVFHRQGVSA